MRHTVFTYYSRTVYAERDRKILDSHIMNDIIETSLKERRVNGDKRSLTGCRQTTGKGNRMTFRNADVEHPVGKTRHFIH